MTTADLLNLGLPFVIRSPGSTRVEPPPWWDKKLNSKWVISAYDHAKKNLFVGSGETWKEMLDDLEQALDPERAIDLGSVDLPKP